MSGAQMNGELKEARLPQGTIRYREAGPAGAPPIVLVHGALVNGLLWRKVVPELEGEFRCIVPDLPLGSHKPALAEDADLTPPGLARLVDDFMGDLGLDGVTLVGNDTGGAICQLVATRHPDRLARLVLTPCDAYENFLPPAFKYLQVSARIPGAMTLVAQTMRLKASRRMPIAYGWLTKRPVDDAVMDAWVEPILTDRGVRRDGGKLLRGISKRYTLEAAEQLRQFEKPVLLAWAPEDRFFKWRYAERLAEAIPNSRLERIEDSYSFVSEDQPERTAELIGEFARG
jgi:pimeloyl-ACP methyl ester carboxylesterase